ncbi:MAG: serine/threonine-protein kinase [Thermoguttaceae bacterium]
MKFEQLGPYRIVRELGRGGMGTVFEGVNLDTDEPAAVKLLAAPLAAEDDFRSRFEAEIEALRKLNHPNIVRLFGFGEQDGQLFYAMELVEGRSLESEFGRGRRFDWREVTRIGIDTCGALRHAHDRGVIHRDLKPGNLLLSNEGQLKLSDFGIARLFGHTRQTAVGSVVGTAEFMSPEQAEGRPTGPRSDLYSLGAVLYVLLSGRQLFQTQSFREMLDKQRYERPDPVGEHAPDTPLKLQAIIAQLLEKDPARRIPNAAILARRLDEMQQSLSLPLDPQRPLNNDVPPDGSDATDPLESEDGPSRSASGDLPPTRAIDDPSSVAAASQSLQPASDDLPETRATGAFDEPAVSNGHDNAKRNVRFTAVADEELDRTESPPAKTAWISPQTWLLIAALIGVGVTAWYLLQDPTPDDLYRRISVHATDKATGSLLQAEEDIRRFLMLFPEDSRCQELRRHERRIDLLHLERKLELCARGLAGTESLVPIELDFLEAINYVRLDPVLGLVKLEALVNLYGREEAQAGPTGNCLELARWRLEQLHAQLDEKMGQHANMVADRLDEADRVLASDPEHARAIYEAVIELYNNKPWAAEAVERAREALAR